MKGPVRTVLWGLADPRQALEAGLMGLDAAVVLVGSGPGEDEGEDAFVDAETAAQVARALPPLTTRLAWLTPGTELPPGFGGVVTRCEVPRVAGALVRIVRAEDDRIEPGRIPADADAVWVPPGPGASTTTRFDFDRLAWLGQHVRTVVEVPAVDDGLETVVRLGRPYAVLFGAAVRFRPGIVDLDELERALASVARLNKAAFGGA